MNAETLTLPLAFLAGLLSFASPCVLPLVPAYIGYLGGTAALGGASPEAGRATPNPFFHALSFVLGFMVVFVLLGASATLIGQFLLDYRLVLQRVGAVLLVIFGMRLMGLGWSRRRWFAAAVVVALVTLIFHSGLLVGEPLRFDGVALTWLAESLMLGLVVFAGAGVGLPLQIALGVAAGLLNLAVGVDDWVPRAVTSILIAASTVLLNRTDFFYTEKRIEVQRRGQAGIARSFLFGLVFAAGWTPCIGPILAGILIVASQLSTVTQGILFLTIYSLGLGLPFLLVGLAFGPLSRGLRRMNRYLGVLSLVSGGLLVLMGILLLTNSLAFLARYGSFFDFGL